ncbi:DUF4913 domain-containing protein [Corynebacterium oculi]|uniref:DUF4913 domain-containing protein n=1 Tax=Corynebacterium oculi TaxID=1544416 RepID=UPI0006D8D659|nr:DUF4913 domain-containing protein [Corynebacterium oculi]
MSTEEGLVYPTVYHFVEEFIAVMYPSVAGGDTRWAPQWWKHKEAVTRLTALWKRFEQLRLEEPGTYVETFLRVHGDYHMGVLQRPGGVFSECEREDTPSMPLRCAPLDGSLDEV